MTLTTRITSAVTALALAFGLFATSAAPVRASDTAAKIIFGAAAIAIIAGAVNAQNKRQAVPQKRYYRAAVLPQHCKLTVRSNHKTRQAYRGRCLQRAGLRGLPQRCIVGEWRGAVFGARCLRRNGYVQG